MGSDVAPGRHHGWLPRCVFPDRENDPSIQATQRVAVVEDVPAARIPHRGRLHFAPREGDTASVTLGRCRFSSGPRVIDDFSGANIPSALRILARVKNMDGPDDIASAVPSVLSDASQPFAEIGLLALLFPLVVLAAKEAVTSARAGYTRLYPGQVGTSLEERRRMIEALAQCGASGDELAPLRSLLDKAVTHFDAWQRARGTGFLSLLKFNFANKRHRRPGNSDLGKLFMREADAVLNKLLERDARSVSDVLWYRIRRMDRTERETLSAKFARLPALCTGAGMSGMASGMVVSCGAAASEAGSDAAASAGNIAGQAAAASAGQALESTASGVLLVSQVAQGASGALNAYVHHGQRRQLLEDGEAVRATAGQLPGSTALLFEQDIQSRASDSLRSQICDAGLTVGQTIMAGANIATLATGGAAAPVTAGLAVPGAVLTVAASVGAAFNEARQARYLGDGADEPVKAQLRQEDFGERLGATPIDTVIGDVSTDFLRHQQLAVQTRLWRDILKALKVEHKRSAKAPASAEQRQQQVRARNESRSASRTLLREGVRRLHDLREQSYPLSWFRGSALQLQERLHLQLQRHPAAPLIQALPEFRREVLFKTARDLTRSADPAVQALFRGEDGRLRPRLQDDAAFFELVNTNAEVYAAHLRRHNEALARHLEPANLFGRADSGNALADLAHAKQHHGLRQPFRLARG